LNFSTKKKYKKMNEEEKRMGWGGGEERDKYVGISHVVSYHLSNTQEAIYIYISV